jgi:hypothetical protein
MTWADFAAQHAPLAWTLAFGLWAVVCYALASLPQSIRRKVI